MRVLKRMLCFLRGHDFNTSVIEEISKQMWSPKIACSRCGKVKPDFYFTYYQFNYGEPKQ